MKKFILLAVIFVVSLVVGLALLIPGDKEKENPKPHPTTTTTQEETITTVPPSTVPTTEPPSTTSTTEVEEPTTTTIPELTFVCPEGNLETLRDLQASVDQGHQPWRLDPYAVVQACTFGSDTVFVENVEEPHAWRAVSSDGTNAVVTMEQPLGPNTVWGVTSISYVGED